MKKLIHLFFEILGVIFFALIIALTYLFIADPFNLKPLFINNEPTADTMQSVENNETQAEDVFDKNPALSAEQEKHLETLGVNPANLPATITAEQEICFEEKLGQSRVAEIKSGDLPTPTEFFKARECISI
jgi:hypothetical protein